MPMTRKRFFGVLTAMWGLGRFSPSDRALAGTPLKGPRPDPTEVLDEARKLALAGRFEEALQKHVWYHENALKDAPSHSGVRVSFALSDWERLGAKYPRALQVLADIRAHNVATLLEGGGDSDLYRDVVALDRHLQGPPQAVELFKRIDADDPKKAAACYFRAEDALIKAGESQLCGKYLDNPSERFERMKLLWRRQKEFDERPRPDGRTPPPMADRMFVEKAVRTITILVRNGRQAEAERFRDEALKIVDSPAIREAVDKAAEPAKTN